MANREKSISTPTISDQTAKNTKNSGTLGNENLGPPTPKKPGKGDRKHFREYLQPLKNFVKRKEYIPGDTYRYIFQKSLEIHHSYIYYRVGISLAHGFLLVVSIFSLFTPCQLENPVSNKHPCNSSGISTHISWFFYLTSWGVSLNFSQSVIVLVLTVRAYYNQKSCKLRNTIPTFLLAKNEHKLLSITGTFWGLSTSCTILAFIIDATYWAVIFNYSQKITLVLINNCSEHLFNLVFMIVDKCIAAYPAMLTHTLFLLIISITYVAVSITYFAAGGLDQFDEKDYLYEFLNWHYPLKALLSFIMLTTVAMLLVVLLTIGDHYKHKKLRPQQVYAEYENMMATHAQEKGHLEPV